MRGGRGGDRPERYQRDMPQQRNEEEPVTNSNIFSALPDED